MGRYSTLFYVIYIYIGFRGPRGTGGNRGPGEIGGGRGPGAGGLFIDRQKHKTCFFVTWILASRPLELALGRKNHVDFESAITNAKCFQPEGKN